MVSWGYDMAMEEHPKETNVSTELAKERTREAADRTLMAWIRTCLSLIGFGFGIAKFRDVLVEVGLHRGPEHLHSTLNSFLVDRPWYAEVSSPRLSSIGEFCNISSLGIFNTPGFGQW